MYKVFYNDRTVFFTQEDVHIAHQPDAEKLQFKNKNHLKLAIDDFKNNATIKNLYVIHSDAEAAFHEFMQLYNLIEAAGGVVVNARSEVLFIKRRNKWDLPKGKLEKGESHESGALREVEEECGIDLLEITKPLGTTYHTYALNDEPILKRTYWFAMQFKGNKKPVPQSEEDITEVRWFNPTDLSAVIQNTFPSIIDVLKKSGYLK